MAIETQFGYQSESTWGTPVTVNKFLPITSESIAPVVDKVESDARRAGIFVQRNDISLPIYKGAAGTVEMPIFNKGFGWWLTHMVGTLTSGAVTDGAVTHTGTVSTLINKSFTCQVNRRFMEADSNQTFTYEGCKIASWEIAASVDEPVTASFDIDAENELTNTALATASYPTGLELLSWAHSASSVTIAGTAVPVTKVSVKCDNALKTDRYRIQSSGLKRQQLQNGYRTIEFELECDWESITQYNRVVSTTTSGQYAQIVIAIAGPTLIGTSSRPSLTITIPAARFDQVSIDNGMDPTMQTLSGVARFDGTNSPITLAYVSADTSYA